jgi:ankyrin repeat protein
MSRNFFISLVAACFAGQVLPAQTKVDFVRDVQPLLKESCIGCHGPVQQMSGFRLDRRRDAMRGGTIAVIAPGNSAGSRLYHKLIGGQYGMQMPPTGALPADKIEIIKAWIDQGAPWPDEVAGDIPPTVADPRAARLIESLRSGDRAAFTRQLREDPKAANLKGRVGSTPLMYAVLYADAQAMKALLDNGADPNARNDAGATALMWAVPDVEKTKLLLDRGANPNARSEDARTPLLIAAGSFDSAPAVKLLLDKGADPNVKAPFLFGETAAVTAAAVVGNDAAMRLLLDRGADPKGPGFLALLLSMRAQSPKCIEMMAPHVDTQGWNMLAAMSGPPLGDAAHIGEFLDKGVDPNGKNPDGLTLLMLAASSDEIPVRTVKALIDKGADVNARSAKGQSALDFAKLRGQTAVVDLLVKAGAKEGTAPTAPQVQAKPAASARAALERSLPLLQRTDSLFLPKSGCVSCHNNTLAAMSVASARKHGIAVDETIAAHQVKSIATYLESWRERALQGVGIPGDSDTVSYILLGLAAEKHPADEATDAMARYLKTQQWPDGNWRILAHRPPIESSDVQVTAASVGAIRAYAPKAQRAEYDAAIRRAAAWLRNAPVKTTEERTFQLLGLKWAGASESDDAIRRGSQALVAEQRHDGGWAQIPTLQSDAYATGQALFALRESGTASSDPAYKRGVQFLLKTQLQDGSWYVRSRAIPLQPFFESGFPHGHDQWISAAASNWAALALAPAVEARGSN